MSVSYLCAHIVPSICRGRVGEAELRLGWGKFGGMQGRGKVGRSFEGEKVSVSIGVSRRGEGVLAVL